MAREAPANATDQLSAAQIAWYAQQAGFGGGDVARAVAVALAESGGRINAKGGPNKDGSYDYGLWQINEKAHPDLITADAQWWVAGFNAQMAFKVYSAAGNTFRPWSTFTSGAYLPHMGAALLGAGNPDSSGLVQAGDNTVIEHNPISDLVAPFKSIAGAVFKTSVWVANPHNWGRAAFIAVGGALVIGSLAIMAKPYIMGAAAPIVNAAADVVPGGGAVKKAAKAAAKGTK
jgi:hypothetical protein